MIWNSKEIYGTAV